MNVIRPGKLGVSGSTCANKRQLISGAQKPRGRGRGALDFDIIQYRPGQRIGISSSSSSGVNRTPSNLALQMAITSSVRARRTQSASTQNDSGKITSSASVFAYGQSLKCKLKPIREESSSVSRRTQSSSTITPKHSVRKSIKTPWSSLLTPKNAVTTPSTPTSTNTSCDPNSYVVLAITEGRGHARGEVGIAVIDVKRPRLILCQLSDRQTYTNTLTKISIFHPAEILVPHTFVDSNQPNKLYHLLESKYPFIQMTKVQRRLFRDSEGLLKVQGLCLPENSSCQLILQDKFYALAASAALLKYVEFVQNVIFTPHSLKVEYQGAHHGTVIDVKTAKDLELLLNQQSNNATHTLISVMDHCSTHGGSRLLRASLLHPPCSLPTITHRQDSVQEIVDNPEISQKLREVLKQLPDVEQLLTLCMQTPSTIDSSQAMETRINYVLMLKATVDSLPLIASALENAKSFLLCKAFKCLQDSRGDQMRQRILQTVNEDVKAPKGGKTAIFQRCFAIKSGVHDLLDVGRKTYCELVNDIHDHVLDLSGTYSLPLKMVYTVTKGYHIQITIQRSNPIKKSDLPPYFLQVQSSKNCLSCTTDILIHANERVKQVTSEILGMSNTLLAVILNDIREHISYLYEMCESIAEVDLILSLAQVSCCHNYVRPKFGDCLSLKASRHPILESISSCVPIANDIEASSWENLSLITGPNMSGKSVLIKQVLLLQIMGQIGSYIPAEEATFRITDRIFSHLNFDDSIENNASTLALEMKEMQLILSSLTATSIVALDELCRGTSVEEGTAIAWALCEKLSESTAFVFVTTHFKELTRLSTLYPCIKNLYLETVEHEFSDKKIRLLYSHRLLPGVNPVKNYGLCLAESLGVPESIIESAKSVSTKLKNIAEAKLSFSSGDEAYIMALYKHKLKALAVGGNISKEDLIKLQSDLRSALCIAAQKRAQSASNKNPLHEESKIPATQVTYKLDNLIPNRLKTNKEKSDENNDAPNKTNQSKLCAYSSSSGPYTSTAVSPFPSERGYLTTPRGLHCESPNFPIMASKSDVLNLNYSDCESPGLRTIKNYCDDSLSLSELHNNSLILSDRNDTLKSSTSIFSYETLVHDKSSNHSSPNYRIPKHMDDFSKHTRLAMYSDSGASCFHDDSDSSDHFDYRSDSKSENMSSPISYNSSKMSPTNIQDIPFHEEQNTNASLLVESSTSCFKTSMKTQVERSKEFSHTSPTQSSSSESSFNFLNQNLFNKSSVCDLFFNKDNVTPSQHSKKALEEVSPAKVTHKKMRLSALTNEEETPMDSFGSKSAHRSVTLNKNPVGKLLEEKQECYSRNDLADSSQDCSDKHVVVKENLFALKSLMDSYIYSSDSDCQD